MYLKNYLILIHMPMVLIREAIEMENYANCILIDTNGENPEQSTDIPRNRNRIIKFLQGNKVLFIRICVQLCVYGLIYVFIGMRVFTGQCHLHPHMYIYR